MEAPVKSILSEVNSIMRARPAEKEWERLPKCWDGNEPLQAKRKTLPHPLVRSTDLRPKFFLKHFGGRNHELDILKSFRRPFLQTNNLRLQSNRRPERRSLSWTIQRCWQSSSKM